MNAHQHSFADHEDEGEEDLTEDLFFISEGGEDDEPLKELACFGHSVASTLGEVDVELKKLEDLIDFEDRRANNKNKKKPRVEPLTHWEPGEALDACRFHDFGAKPSLDFYTKHIAPGFPEGDRERQWVAFKVELDGTFIFVGISDFFQNDMLRLLEGVQTGSAGRRRKQGEGDANAFNELALVSQMGHALFRAHGCSLSSAFLRVTMLHKETDELRALPRGFSRAGVLEKELEFVSNHNAWLSATNSFGLNIWNAFEGKLQLRGGVRQSYLQKIVPEKDKDFAQSDVAKVFESFFLNLPRQPGQTVFEALPPEAKAELVDWFLSPACLHCNWLQLVNRGGIAVHAREPKAYQKGERFVYFYKFHERPVQ
jgi:hypothetical protein